MNTDQDVEEFRSYLINQLILFSAFASLIEATILINHLPTLGVTNYFVLRMTLIIGLWLLMLFRHQISYFGRVNVLMGMTWISIVAHLAQFGPAMNAKSFLITLTFFAMIFISERVGWIIVASIIGIFAVLGALVTQGYLVYHFDYQAHVQKPLTWVGIAFNLTAYSAITGYVAMKLVHFLQKLLVQSRAQMEALQEAKEKLETANRAKQEFLDNMSHELNTPLHGLLGHLQLLQDTKLTWQQRGHLASIRQGSEHLHTLVNAILDTARLERQQVLLNPIPCVLPELLKHVVNMIQLKAQANELDFQWFPSQPLPEEILVDTLRLRQILLNLLTNAVKYTPKGHVHLIVSCMERVDKQAILTFAISDSGIGIPPEEQQRLLQPFERGNTLGQHGAGLGLSIVRQLLQQMNSQLEIESSTAGSCFRFSIKVPILRPAISLHTSISVTPPVVPPLQTLQIYQQNLLLGRLPTLKRQLEQLSEDNQYHFFTEQALQLLNVGDKIQLATLFCSFFPPEQPIPSLKNLPLGTNSQYPRVLVIDDDNFNIHLIAHYLRDFEFDLLSANHGIEGVNLARQTLPQLILLDVYMPGMNGFEVCQQLKADEQLQAIPVIFFSASNQSKDIAAAFTNQGQDYILKPAHEEEVIARVTAHLDRSTLYYSLVNRLVAYRTRQEMENYAERLSAQEISKQSKEIIDKMYQIRDLLLNDLEVSPKLDEIARQVNLNRNRLNDEFKALFGSTVFVWLREQRLRRGRELLRNSDLSIQDISIQVGYPAQSQFSRMFKQRFGQSPTEYRSLSSNRLKMT